MSWTIEVHLTHTDGRKPNSVVTLDDDLPTAQLVAIVQMGARFALSDGYRYVSDKPWVNPIEKKIIYYCEGWKDD